MSRIFRKPGDYVRDPAAWTTPPLPDGERFRFSLENVPPDFLPTAKALDVGSERGIFAGQELLAAEWGYAARHLATGSADGAGRVMNNTFLEGTPKTRREALELLREFVMEQFFPVKKYPMSARNGHYCWHHYAGEFGLDMIGSEIGEGIHSYQLHFAMNRGAARQYGKPWFVDFSSWHGPGCVNYESEEGKLSRNSGHSLNLMERSMIAAYTSGANGVLAEAGGFFAFYKETDPETGLHRLTPYGEVCRKINAFTQKHPDVGIPYTPLAVVLDRYHGMDRRIAVGRVLQAFGKFPYTAGDMMTYHLAELLWGDLVWMAEETQSEIGTLLHPRYGDRFDFLLQNAAQNVLDSYPVLLLSGDITLSPKEAERFGVYVKRGGALVLNTAYLKFFPEYEKAAAAGAAEISDGDGRVLVYGPDYSIENLAGILDALTEELVPFRFSADIESIVNVADGGFILTLINNEGVTKEWYTPPVVDESKAVELSVRYVGACPIRSVTEIYEGRTLRRTDDGFRIVLPPGGIAVVRIGTADEN
jgi:hypothetical protein